MSTSWPFKIALVALAIIFARPAHGQSCPQDNDDDPTIARSTSTLRGTVVRHHELRTWLGLNLDRPACGQSEIELTFDNSSRWREAESLRHCRVTVNGAIFESPSGYYSTLYAIQNADIQQAADCHPYPLAPDPSKFTIPANLQSYRVSIKIDTRGNGHTVVNVRKSLHRSLPGPWLSYVSYWLNGGGDLVWLGCGDHFTVSNVSAHPDSAFHDPDGPVQYGVRLRDNAVNKMRIACRRTSTDTKSSR